MSWRGMVGGGRVEGNRFVPAEAFRFVPDQAIVQSIADRDYFLRRGDATNAASLPRTAPSPRLASLKRAGLEAVVSPRGRRTLSSRPLLWVLHPCAWGFNLGRDVTR